MLELQLAVDAIKDNKYELIQSDLNNSNLEANTQSKRSKYRGVSLNGKKW